MAETTIPGMDLPYVLKNMLEMLLSKNKLTSWTIHDNVSRGICVSIRFGHVDSASMLVSPCTYRKQSPRQARRNLHRAQSYQNNKLNTTSPSITQIKKRKIHDTDLSPENLRNSDFSLCNTTRSASRHETEPVIEEYEHKDTPYIDTPEPVVKEYDYKDTPQMTPDPVLLEYDYTSVESQHLLPLTQVSPPPTETIATKVPPSPTETTVISDNEESTDIDAHLDDTLDDILQNNYDCVIEHNVHPPVVNPNSHSPLSKYPSSSVSVPHPPYPPEPPDPPLPPDPSSPTNMDDPWALIFVELRRRHIHWESLN